MCIRDRTLTVSANDGWEDVEYAIGALYCLAENGAVVPNLAAGSNPRTAVGQKADGTLIFYTIDGRKTGHSIGASLTQVGERLLELGFIPGTIVRAVQISPLGDPVAYEVLDAVIALRRCDARCVHITVL